MSAFYAGALLTWAFVYALDAYKKRSRRDAVIAGIALVAGLANLAAWLA